MATTRRDILNRLCAVYPPGEARAVLRLLLETRFRLTWADVLCGGVESLLPASADALETMVARLEQGEPVQYVVGEAEFCGRQFKVGRGVLIPRPETELLVEAALAAALQQPCAGGISVLDIGTGSGCIATTMALELEKTKGTDGNWTVAGWDISRDSLRIAADNAARLGAGNTTFRQVDILKRDCADDARRYSVIVSNPPYICHRERDGMQRQVIDHEPPEALFVPDDDPLLFYRTITLFARKALRQGGHLLFETNRAYADHTAQLMLCHGFAQVTVSDDQFGNPRIVAGVLGL